MSRSTFRCLLRLALAMPLATLLAPHARAGGGGLGPLPYLCFDASTTTATGDCGTAQSPFAGMVFPGYFHLEDFEDDSFEPGWSVGGTQSRTPPGAITDSVDEDDGAIDGSGTAGSSFFSGGAFSIDFDAAALGALPTHVGFVWTDGGSGVTVTVEFFGPGHTSLGSIVAPGVGDASINGETAEDRFFGWVDPVGIESVSISHTAGGYEIDHLQYGRLDAPGPAGDSFLCYKAKPTKGVALVLPASAAVTDSLTLTGSEVDVLRYQALCNPADRDGQGIDDPATHLASFAIKPLAPPHRLSRFPVSTPFGQLALDVVKGDRLLLPAAKSLKAPVDPLASPSVEPFECFKAKVSKGTPKLPKGLQVDLADQFGAARTFDVKKPTHLCSTASVDGSKVANQDAALVCLKLKPAKGQPKHEKRLGVFVNSHFGPGQLDTVKEDELCVPAELLIH